MIADPPLAPAETYSAIVIGSIDTIIDDDFEGAVTGWSVSSAALTGGAWEVAVPNGTVQSGQVAAPGSDASPAGTKAWVTQNGNAGGAANAADVDGGPTQLTSPLFSLAGQDGIVSFGRSADEAGAILMATLARAEAMVFEETGRACR